MAQSIPIQLTPIPVPGAARPLDINQLLTIISQYISASISANVSFFLQGPTYPISDQGIFFNTSTDKFGVWISAYGKYIPISDRTVGEIIATFIAGDDLPNGLVALDGRNINTITGLSQSQISNLETLFGVNQLIPKYTFFGALQNLPATGAFSNIAIGAFAPPKGSIGALSIGGSYSQTEVGALRDNTELLLDSATALQNATTQIQAVSETVLESLLNNAASGLQPIWKIFVGFP